MIPSINGSTPIAVIGMLPLSLESSGDGMLYSEAL